MDITVYSVNEHNILFRCGLDWFMVLNATFNNISDVSWWSVLLVEETGVPGEITDLSQETFFFPGVNMIFYS